MTSEPTTAMRMSKLKNGTTEASGLVAVVMVSLETLMKSNPIAFYELVMKCRDPAHEFFGNSAAPAQSLGLVEGGRVHDSIRNVVLSAVSAHPLGGPGDPFDLHLDTPYAAE